MPPIKRNANPNQLKAKETELFHPIEELILLRPSFDSLTSDDYRTVINAAKIIDAGGKKLRVSGEFFDHEGGSLEESFLLAPDWRVGSPFRKLLEVTNTLPAKKEPFNPNQMVGQELVLTMKVVTNGGKEYLNLVHAEALEDVLSDTLDEEANVQ